MSQPKINSKYDLVVIGGGITGAGIFREAVRMGLQTLLIEQRDFAWGTSSRSSKMVHGGLRYLKEGRLMLTRDSVIERERLLKEAPGLVDDLIFTMPIYQTAGPGKFMMNLGLTIYDTIARKRNRRYYNHRQFRSLVPQINPDGLVGGVRFLDAQVDDARLVLRLVAEGIAAGGTALNYIQAIGIQRNDAGEVTGLTLHDIETQKEKRITAGVVVNATGSWAERLHPSPDVKRHIRPLRGSHLVFPHELLPISQAVGFIHPADNRPVFVTPWEGAVLLGTTDVDHRGTLNLEPKITLAEVTYLMNGLHHYFPSLRISKNDCIATFAGIRPVFSDGKRSASQESREHIVWADKGLVTVTGGKLTTFRCLAFDTLKVAQQFIPNLQLSGREESVFEGNDTANPHSHILSDRIWRRLCGRYGRAAHDVVKDAPPEDLEPIPHTHFLWAELPYTARNEQVRHLSDLLLRRVRLGLVTRQGGQPHLARIKKLCQPVLNWDDSRWDQEIAEYKTLWEESYWLPRR